MPKAFRRIILKPTGLSPEDSAKLAERLAAAVDWQRQLTASSPHVLQFTGAIQESDSAFTVEHEPAENVFSAGELFDGNPPEVDEEALLHLTVAIFDAIRAAHTTKSAGSQKTFLAHGGISPGVIVRTQDGVTKMTDFGFASAVCAVLGEESYLNLAVGPAIGANAELDASAVWEILSPDEFEREDRICAFVDPQKYGTGTHATFEPASDVLAAGFLVHLVAEHNHPYLSEPDSHRMVDLSEFMSALKYSGARRRDLRESSNQGILTWCDIIRKAVARVPTERPSSAEAVAAFAQFAKPVDQWDTLRGRIQQLRDTKSWSELRSLAKGVSENSDAPQALRDDAAELQGLASAHLLLERAVDLMKGTEWRDAEAVVKQVVALPALPQDVSDRSKKVQGVLDHNLHVAEAVNRLRTSAGEIDDQDVENALPRVRQLHDDFAKLSAGEATLPAVNDELSRLGAELQQRHAALDEALAAFEGKRKAEAEQLERERQADREKAESWITDLEEARKTSEWDMLSELLQAPPELTHWPADAKPRASDIQKALDDHRTEEALRAEIEESRADAERWLGELKSAVESEDWKTAKNVIAAKPKLRHWPPEVQEESTSIELLVREQLQRQADDQAASDWMSRLEKMLADGDTAGAKTLLVDRPQLHFFPDTIASRASEIESQLLEQEERIGAWVNSARKAAEAQRWEDALHILDDPPVSLDTAGDGVQSEVGQLRRQCTEGKEEQDRRQQAERTKLVKQLAVGFVRDVVSNNLKEFVEPDALATDTSDEKFKDSVQLSSGRARLSVVLSADGIGETEAVTAPFEFESNGDTLRVRDKAKLQGHLVEKLSGQLKELQRSRMATLVKPWRSSLFPKTQISVKLGDLQSRVPASICLLGKDAKRAELKTELIWLPETLSWQLTDEQEFVKSAVNLAVEEAKKAATKKLLEQTDVLKTYRKCLLLDVQRNTSGELSRIPDILHCSAQLSIRPADSKESQPVHAFKFTCPQVGTLSNDFDTAGSVSALEKLVLVQQNESCKKVAALFSKRLGEKQLPAKITPHPARITSPADEVKLKIAAKRRKPVEVTISWNIPQFSYLPPSSWETMCDQIADSPEVGGSKKAFAMIGGVAAVAVGAIGIVLFSGGNGNGVTIENKNGSGRPPEVANRNTNDNSSIAVSTDPQAILVDQWCADVAANDQDCAALREILNRKPSVSPWPADACDGVQEVQWVADNCVDFTPVVLTAIQDVFDDLNGIVPSSEIDKLKNGVLVVGTDVRVPVPGLADGPLLIPSTESEAKDRVSEVRSRVDALQGLLDQSKLPEAVQDDVTKVVAQKLGAFVDESHLSFEVTSGGNWTLFADENQWKIEGMALHVTHPQVAGPAPIPYGAHVSDGRITPFTDEADESVEQRLTQWLRQIQQDSLGKVVGDLGEALPSNATPRAPALTSLSPTVAFVVSDSESRLLDRQLGAIWNRQTLAFDPDAGALDDIGYALRVLNALANHTTTDGVDWLHEAMPDTQVRERSKPADDGSWALSATPPWGDQERLPLLLSWDADPARDSRQTVTAFLKDEPTYWSIARAYREIAVTNGGMYTPPPNQVSDLLGATPPQQLTMAFSLDNTKLAEIKGDYDDESLVSLSLPIIGRWTVDADRIPDGLDSAAIGQAMESAPQDPLSFTLELTADASKLHGQPIQPSARISALEAAIEDYSRREQAERTLFDVLLQESDKVDFSQEDGTVRRDLAANTALEAIWAAKNPGITSVPFRTVVANSRDFNKGKRGSKGANLNTIYPTIFVEYFCGPRNCYAFAFAADRSADGVDPVLAGPFLMKLCPTSAIVNADPNADLGSLLLEPVLATIQDDSSVVISAVGTNKTLGIAIALDDMLSPGRVPSWTLTDRMSTVGPIDRGDRIQSKPISWNSLETLTQPDETVEEPRWRCDYWLYTSLARSKSTPQDPPDDEARRWATEVVARATTPAE